jgi:hypothetical protein
LVRYLVLLHNSDQRVRTLSPLCTLLTNTRTEEGETQRRSGLTVPDRHFRASMAVLFRLGILHPTQPIGLASLRS